VELRPDEEDDRSAGLSVHARQRLRRAAEPFREIDLEEIGDRPTVVRRPNSLNGGVGSSGTFLGGATRLSAPVTPYT